jgi:hypothetical protein
LWNGRGALAPNEPIGSERALMPRPGGNNFLAPFVKALENKKKSEIALRLNSYKPIFLKIFVANP